jgi:CRISPR system Cascade subunit CasC
MSEIGETPIYVTEFGAPGYAFTTNNGIKETKMLVQLHILQNYGPSAPNRDGDGAPKMTLLGDVPRARISSQCLKRTSRDAEQFKGKFSGRVGYLSRRLPGEVARWFIREKGLDDKKDELLLRAMVEPLRSLAKSDSSAGGQSKKAGTKPPPVTETEGSNLIFFTDREVEEIGKALFAEYEEASATATKEKKLLDLKEFEKRKAGDVAERIKAPLEKIQQRAVDISLFGRFDTTDAFKDVEAAIQVAHAITTNRVDTLYDFFTAKDDITGEAPAAHMDTHEYISGTFYRYISIHWDQLIKNLDNDQKTAKEVIGAIINASLVAVPRGGKNPYAHFYRPDFVLIEVGANNEPINLGNAFLKPVQLSPSTRESLMEVSISKLWGYMQRIRRMYEINTTLAYSTTQDVTLSFGASEEEDKKAQKAPKPFFATSELRSWVLEQISALADKKETADG